MPPPAGYTDFYELDLKINYNNSRSPYLQDSAALGSPPQERQAGWTERYNLYLGSAVPNGVNLPFPNVYNLLKARCALLGVNFYIKWAVCHQGSVFKSSYPLPNSASLPLWDSQSLTPNRYNQLCSSPEENLLIRMEAGSLRRWEHGIRGIKDYMSDDAMSYFPATSYYDGTPDITNAIFDTIQTTVPNPAFNGFAQANFTVTNVNGSISAPVLVGGQGGTWPGVADGTYPTYFYSAGGQTVAALGTVTFVSQVATAASIYANRKGAGYTGTAVYVPVSNDPYGLPNYLPPSTYWSNFISCLISFVQSGTTTRIANNTFTSPQPTFPSGLAPAIISPPAKCNRSMIQRVGNRQTGQIRLTKPARVKRGI